MHQKAVHKALKKVHSIEKVDELYNAAVIKMREIESERYAYGSGKAFW